MSTFALLFILLFIVSIGALLFVGPIYGFYFYQINYFLNPNSRWWYSSVPGLSYSFIIVVLMLGAFVFTRKKHSLNMPSVVPELKWLAAVFISFVFAYVVAVSFEYHHRFFIEYLKMIVVMYVAFRIVDTEKKLKTALLCFIIGAAYIGFEAQNVGRNAEGRVEGIGMVDSLDANMTALALVPTIPLLIYFVWNLSWPYKILVGLLGAFIVNGLVLINSRGAFLGMVASGIYFLGAMLFTKNKIKNQKTVAIVLMLVGAAVFIRLADNTFWERLDTLDEQSSAESEGSGGRRINFWLATFDLMEDYPLGVGIYGYQLLSENYIIDQSSFQTSLDTGQKIRAVHSFWFQGLSEIGWHGMSFIFVLFWSLKKGLKKSRIYLSSVGKHELYFIILALEAGFMGFLITASFIDSFRVQVFYWMILFCCCALAISRNDEALQSKA